MDGKAKAIDMAPLCVYSSLCALYLQHARACMHGPPNIFTCTSSSPFPYHVGFPSNMQSSPFPYQIVWALQSLPLTCPSLIFAAQLCACEVCMHVGGKAHTVA